MFYQMEHRTYVLSFVPNFTNARRETHPTHALQFDPMHAQEPDPTQRKTHAPGIWPLAPLPQLCPSRRAGIPFAMPSHCSGQDIGWLVCRYGMLKEKFGLIGGDGNDGGGQGE